jgi:hypothetical protein
MSSTCKYCGQEVIFRWLGGRIVPIHPDGGWECGWSGSSSYVSDGPEYRHSVYVSDDFTRPTTCPKCGAHVFFVRHNGGSVWFDELGWPWPKHGCFDYGDDDFERFSRLRKRELENGRFGVVVATVNSVESGKQCWGVRWSDGGKNCMKVAAPNKIDPGVVVAEPKQIIRRRIFTANGLEFKVEDEVINPKILGLGEDWASAQSETVAVPKPRPIKQKCPHCSREMSEPSLWAHILWKHCSRGDFAEFVQKVRGKPVAKSALEAEPDDETTKRMKKVFEHERARYVECKTSRIERRMKVLQTKFDREIASLKAQIKRLGSSD